LKLKDKKKSSSFSSSLVPIGYLKQLVGLNLYKNPMEYPPQHIINGGVKLIKAFLREHDELNKVNTEMQVFKDVEEDENLYSTTRDVWDSDEVDDDYQNLTEDSSDLKHTQQSSTSSKTKFTRHSSSNQKKNL
jgi:hypothetical protein